MSASAQPATAPQGSRAQSLPLRWGLSAWLAVSVAAASGRPMRYLESSTVRKEDVARQMLQDDPIDTGLVGVLSCVEPCMTWQVFRSKQAKTQELRRRPGKCLHHYFYFLDPDGNRIEIYCWMMTVSKSSVAAPEPDL